MQSDEEDTATSTRKQRNKARKAERKAAKKQFNSSKKAKMSENDSAREESTESEPVTLPTIYFKNGWRYVQPYAHTFRVTAKARWFGRTIGDVVVSEYRTYSREYWMHAFEYGLIQLNDKPVSSDTKIGQHDVICHRVHRHEPPVFAKAPLTIVHQDENLVVIDKPSSIPVHPTGKFWFNSVESIMKFEMSLGSLFPVHRLDRLTSGVLVFAKNKQVAQTWSAMIREHQGVHKEYIARVEGKFPSEPVEVDQPIKVFEFKNDICRVDPSGKPSVTVFELLATNGVESVVRCLPKTGRTHQIRTHLQWLGYPITNDPLYNPKVRASRTSAIIEEDGETVEDSFNDHVTKMNEVREPIPIIIPKCVPENSKLAEVDPSSACPDCKRVYKDPTDTEKWLYLHALSYKGPNWEFKTNPPPWATL